MSKISLGHFDRIEIYEPRTVRKGRGIQMVHGIGIAVLVVLAIAVTVVVHFRVAELYGVDTTWFQDP